MFKQIARGAALALCVLAAGCAQDLSPAPAPALPQQAVEAAPEPAAPVGSGRVETDLEEGSLTPEQTTLLQRFMDGYYQALARLQAPEGMDGLFASDAAAQREAGPLPSADHPYDRQAALDYARQYTAARNPAWDDYAGMGGNCQNYVSQCLYAGGIPMDTTGAAVWKWFDGTVANDTTAAGRSSSWSGVDEFLAYAEGNTGYGLAAQTGAPYLTGQPGDLIQMGENGSWRHVVIISQTVTDESGQTIDYLVHSNTSNLENWPASLYGYPQRLLTRIAGWND